MTRSIAEIDALLVAEKCLFGSPEWVEDGGHAKLNSAVVSANGVIIGGLSLRATVLIETTVQRGSAALVLDSFPIQRISFRPDHSHLNKAWHPIPAHLRLKTLPPNRTRIYRWDHNRCWPMRDNMAAGELLEPEPASVMEALEVFLEACGITAYFPEPPHRPKLELK